MQHLTHCSIWLRSLGCQSNRTIRFGGEGWGRNTISFRGERGLVRNTIGFRGKRGLVRDTISFRGEGVWGRCVELESGGKSRGQGGVWGENSVRVGKWGSRGGDTIVVGREP